jgi:hypothetical protein
MITVNISPVNFHRQAEIFPISRRPSSVDFSTCFTEALFAEKMTASNNLFLTSRPSECNMPQVKMQFLTF